MIMLAMRCNNICHHQATSELVFMPHGKVVKILVWDTSTSPALYRPSEEFHKARAAKDFPLLNICDQFISCGCKFSCKEERKEGKEEESLGRDCPICSAGSG